jgi:diacylglycerol kinase (ATP)
LGDRGLRAEIGECLVDRFLRATMNSVNGLRATFRTEAAFRQEVAALVVAVPVAFFIARTTWIWLALVGVVIFTMIVELLNTAVEKLSDRVNTAPDPQIGLVKDVSSAAVGMSLILAGLVWLLAIAERVGLL